MRRFGTKHLWRVAAVVSLSVSVAAESQAQLRAVNRAQLDTTCSPCKDFYRFANGAWLDSVTIPQGYTEWGPLRALQRRQAEMVSQLLDSLAFAPGRSASSALDRKVGTYYRACLADVPDSTSLTALAPLYNRIAAMQTRADLSQVIGLLQRYGVPALVHLTVGAGDRDRGSYYAWITQSRVWTLPKRYYLAADTASARVRDDYRATLGAILIAQGVTRSSAGVLATQVLRVETALAHVDPPEDGATAPRAIATLVASSRAFDWRAFARGLGRPDLSGIIVPSNRQVPVVDSLVAAIPMEEWRAYLQWSVTREILGTIGGLRRLGDEFSNRAFHTPPQPVARACALQTMESMGDAVSEMFVARNLSVQARDAAISMASAIRAVLRERVRAVDWLGPASRDAWVARLDSARLWIGYPNRWTDYGRLEIRDRQPTANLLAARRFELDREIATVGHPIDRERWTDVVPAIADGTYLNNEHALAITAAELAGPFFDPRAEPAANFGKIGQVMGHELTHSLYSVVRLAGEAGFRDDRWTPDEVSTFTRRAKLLVDQYDLYFVNDSVHVNGRKTLSENLADIGGISLAWLAFQRAIEGKPRQLIAGFTPEQRFFIAYAQSINSGVWSPSEVMSQSQVDGYAHSPPRWRINGPLANFAPFAAAFGCRQGDAMVRPPSLRWSVW